MRRLKVLGLLLVLLGLVWGFPSFRARMLGDLTDQAIGLGFILVLALAYPLLPGTLKRFVASGEQNALRMCVLLVCIVAAEFAGLGVSIEYRIPESWTWLVMVAALGVGILAARTLMVLGSWILRRLGSSSGAADAAPEPVQVGCAGCGQCIEGRPADLRMLAMPIGILGYGCGACGAVYCRACKKGRLGWSWGSGFSRSTCPRCNRAFVLRRCLLDA